MQRGFSFNNTRIVCIGFSIAAILAGLSGPAAPAAADNASAQRFTVTIETGKTGKPVSKYIYGQFIEHLGRCIYGGIWAEMLEDRKFYYPVGADKSPWRIIGPDQDVVMVRNNSYVGEHTPQVELAGKKARGIEQEGLALIGTKEYTGRIVIAGDPEAAPVKVSLIWGEGKNARKTVTISEINTDFVKVPLRFKTAATTDNGRLEIVGLGRGTFQIGTVSLMPADNVNGIRADTLKLLKELDSPIYRWPGGNFVSGYDWRDGIGDPDKRPPRWDFAWNALESNDFGLDEFIVFCRLLGTEPSITVNSGFGDSHSAAKEVEYANGSVDTPMGKWRADNGHRQPYNVKWWYVGNEMWGKFQLGYMELRHYVIKHNHFARAMRKADPSIKLIAVGRVGEWSEKMLTTCTDQMDLISEHFYCRRKDLELLPYVSQIPDNVKRICDAHRDYRKRLQSLKGRDIPIAIDEWNYGKGGHFFLKDALGITAGLHEMIRNSDIVFMANYAQTVNVLGAIKTTRTDAAFETTGLVFKLYRRHFGTLPVAVTGDTNPLDVVAAWTGDRKALTVAIVNPTKENYELAVDFKGADVSGNGRMWQIAHSNPMAYNEPGKEPQVVIEEKPLSGISNKLSVSPLSISIYELIIRN